MSARFVGARGYLVTYRQIDPLFALDLSDPTNPRVTGELKIPGFSSYLHPLDDDHLLTIGTVEQTGVAWPRKVQLQIFDVSDSTMPRQVHAQIIGDDWGSTQTEHRAFTFLPETKLLAIPHFEVAPGATDFTSNLQVFHVDVTTDITRLGAVDVHDMVDCGDPATCWGWWWSPMVRRGVIAGDFVYAVTSGGVRVAHIASPSTSIATAVFPAAP